MNETVAPPMSAPPAGVDVGRLAVGDALPPLTKNPTTRQLVMYAGATGDFYELHYDHNFAREAGLDGVIVHGLLKAGWLGEFVTSWAGPDAFVCSLEVSYRGMDFPGVDFEVNGTVASIAPQEDGSTLVDLDIWAGPEGGRTTTARSTVQFFA